MVASHSNHFVLSRSPTSHLASPTPQQGDKCKPTVWTGLATIFKKINHNNKECRNSITSHAMGRYCFGNRHQNLWILASISYTLGAHLLVYDIAVFWNHLTKFSVKLHYPMVPSYFNGGWLYGFPPTSMRKPPNCPQNFRYVLFLGPPVHLSQHLGVNILASSVKISQT